MEHDPAALNELLQRGLKAVPVTIFGDKVVVGFNPRALARLFGIKDDASAGLDTAAMVAKFETVFAAALRATRQLPPERLAWVSPERERTLRQFTFHLIDRAERALNAYQVGAYTEEDAGRDVAGVLGLVDFEETARYGEEVLRRVKGSLTGPVPLDLGRVLDTYMGPKTTGELLDLALGHSVHHLKQLYQYMSLIGLKPLNPLGPSDLEGIAVPTELF